MWVSVAPLLHGARMAQRAVRQEPLDLRYEPIIHLVMIRDELCKIVFVGFRLTALSKFADLRQIAVRWCVLAGYALALSCRLSAAEVPANCNLQHGGLGNISQGGINFNVSQAHIGDTVTVTPSLGMVQNACQCINATGTVWIATGKLTNFLINATLNPGTLTTCPAGVSCAPGPYNLLITPALVGAGVATPLGSINGSANSVRVVQNGVGTVQTGTPTEQMADFHTATLPIVTPCIAGFKEATNASGSSCFLSNTPVTFTGYITNCGNIALKNIVLTDDRAISFTVLSNGVPAQPLGGPYTLATGKALTYSGSFVPTAGENSAGGALTTTTVRVTDTTIIGGPNASLTNSFPLSCRICVPISITQPTYTPDGWFQFNVTGAAGSNYVVQVATNLPTTNWRSLFTNAAPFSFVDTNTRSFPKQFYRAKTAQ